MVYLVDDDSEDLEIVQQAIFEHSYKGPVLTLGNGKRLIEKLTTDNGEEKPEVIVLDLNMPLVDGFETLSRIRQHPVFQKTPVIILTASSNKADEERCYALGCNSFLTKPSKMSDYKELTVLIKQFLGSQAASRDVRRG